MQKATEKTEILSLFSGCGGLDLGFEEAGFVTGLAYDKRPDAISSWNRNRKKKVARVGDISKLSLSSLDNDYGDVFKPSGVIGGPPCQGFSLANRGGNAADPRNQLVHTFFDLALQLHQRSPLDFIVMENVPAIAGVRGGDIVSTVVERLSRQQFSVFYTVLDAADYGVAQRRKRFILVALRKQKFGTQSWARPEVVRPRPTVRDAIANLPEPTYFRRGFNRASESVHENHWCMTPRSKKFFDGTLSEGFKERRSFKTLLWDEPSYTVSYGNREVHVHPNTKRRLSVFEAMRLQGFPDWFTLNGTLSSQITQVSEAVPPPMAYAVASSISSLLLSPRI